MAADTGRSVHVFWIAECLAKFREMQACHVRAREEAERSIIKFQTKA
jgi:hypothetical protein